MDVKYRVYDEDSQTLIWAVAVNYRWNADRGIAKYDEIRLHPEVSSHHWMPAPVGVPLRGLPRSTRQRG